MIPRRCFRCYRPVWVWPWRPALCRDFDSCVAEYEADLIEVGYVEEPPPLMFERPPDDIDKCSRCMGFGSVIRNDWEMGPVYEDCDRCMTTGVDPSLCPV